MLPNSNFDNAVVANGPGPCWRTDYTFTTNGGQATGLIPVAIGGHPNALYINVGGTTTTRVVFWSVALVNGQAYRASVALRQGNVPFGFRLAVGNTTVVTAVGIVGVWNTSAADFTWTGVTGVHQFALFSTNVSGTSTGNDHYVDDLYLSPIAHAPISDAVCTELVTNGTFNTNLAGWTTAGLTQWLTGRMYFGGAGGAGGTGQQTVASQAGQACTLTFTRQAVGSGETPLIRVEALSATNVVLATDTGINTGSLVFAADGPTTIRITDVSVGNLTSLDVAADNITLYCT